jgi:NTP pyrophosphatase (non-canonical NTP hydrolase)
MMTRVRDFMEHFASMQKSVHENSVEHGFWEGDQNSYALKLALIHSEVSEALEALRSGNPSCVKEGLEDISSLEEELADIVIRVMDLAEMTGSDLGGAIYEKARYNERRPYKHGKKF